jgi:hypothetical protein
MATTMTGTGITYNSGLTQLRTRPIIKHRLSGCTSVDQGLPNGNWDFINGTEIDMGVPQNSQNWYRCEFYTDTDDQGGSNGGSGYALYRWTPSSGWDRILDYGWHANYDNNAGDFYTSIRSIWYAPVHQSYPTQQHVFRVYGRRHPDVAMRCNCSIGADYRHDNWNNGMFEIWELDYNWATTTNLSRY